MNVVCIIDQTGDSDTKILFTDDDINITVGGVNMVDFTEAGSDEITFNEAGADLDVRIEGDTDTDLFFTNAGTDRVGVGLNSPSSKLHIGGDLKTNSHITASGNISASGTQHFLRGRLDIEDASAAEVRIKDTGGTGYVLSLIHI